MHWNVRGWHVIENFDGADFHDSVPTRVSPVVSVSRTISRMRSSTSCAFSVKIAQFVVIRPSLPLSLAASNDVADHGVGGCRAESGQDDEVGAPSLSSSGICQRIMAIRWAHARPLKQSRVLQ